MAIMLVNGGGGNAVGGNLSLVGHLDKRPLHIRPGPGDDGG